MQQLITMRQAATVAGYAYGSLKIISHRGEFIEPDLVAGTSYLFHPKRVKAWKTERERKLRRKPK